jgi:hypothetical protein
VARSYALHGEREDTANHLAEARRSAGRFGKFLDTSPNYSLDILTYIQYKLCFAPKAQTSGGSRQPELENVNDATCVDHQDFTKFVLNLRPNRFNDPNSLAPEASTKAICFSVWSCATWCRIALESTNHPKFPGSWKAMGAESGLKDIRWAETVALFTFLWEEWHQPRWSNSYGSSWMVDSQESIGIPGAELLSICCELANLASPGKRSTSDGSLCRRFQQGFTTLRDIHDEELTSKFLQLLYTRTIRGAEEYFDFESIGRIAEQSLPNELRSTDDPFDPNRRSSSSYHSLAASNPGNRFPEPTLASSCRSSNASLQRMRDMQETVTYHLNHRRNETRPTNELPSSAWRMSYSTMASSQISNLSDLMDRSLNLRN